ncbi:hypothetical protein BC937DRAFT_94176 [Endogone sp. FLAS-F59071]|nr:hypothetical protein BC937DRAFT_94176 [Endogone sp. FLAS-F59071]|eukprot:RUS20864.1 hypothetical protein BC937DRAFT_94176 [Endogone sp. FLAS-F59071]
MIATRITDKNAALIPLQEFSQAQHADVDTPVIELNSNFSVVCKMRSGIEATQSTNDKANLQTASQTPSNTTKTTDFVTDLFADTPALSRAQSVPTALTVIRKGGSAVTSAWEAFMLDDSVFLRPPPEAQWVEGEFQSSVVGLLDLAEEITECDKIVAALDRSRKDFGTGVSSLTCHSCRGHLSGMAMLTYSPSCLMLQINSPALLCILVLSSSTRAHTNTIRAFFSWGTRCRMPVAPSRHVRTVGLFARRGALQCPTTLFSFIAMRCT